MRYSCSVGYWPWIQIQILVKSTRFNFYLAYMHVPVGLICVKVYLDAHKTRKKKSFMHGKHTILLVFMQALKGFWYEAYTLFVIHKTNL